VLKDLQRSISKKTAVHIGEKGDPKETGPGKKNTEAQPVVNTGGDVSPNATKKLKLVRKSDEKGANPGREDRSTESSKVL